MTSRPVEGARLYFSLALRTVSVDCPQSERNTSQVFLNLEVQSRAITQHNPDIAFPYRVFSLTWPASMQIHYNKRKRFHKKRVQLPQDWFGTPTWPPFRCFGTPIWPP